MPIRLATPDDADAGAALLTSAQPDGLATAAGIRHRFRSIPAEARYTTWIEADDGLTRGWATCGLDWMSTIPGDSLCHVAVHPGHRGRGVGSALWGLVARHLEEIGARRVLAEALDEEAAIGFATARGFTVTASTTILALDPRSLPEPGAPPAGVELHSFRSLGDDLEAAYRADYETTQDEPGDHDSAGMTFEAWLAATVRNPTFSKDASNAVAVDGEIVGSTLLYVDETTGRALNGGTGVSRPHRGRGLATLMKRHALAEAARLGVTRVITQNDEGNAAMLAVNARLGYTPFAKRLQLVRPATDPV